MSLGLSTRIPKLFPNNGNEYSTLFYAWNCDAVEQIPTGAEALWPGQAWSYDADGNLIPTGDSITTDSCWTYDDDGDIIPGVGLNIIVTPDPDVIIPSGSTGLIISRDLSSLADGTETVFSDAQIVLATFATLNGVVVDTATISGNEITISPAPQPGDTLLLFGYQAL